MKLNEQALTDARTNRDRLILEAVDEHGWTQYRVARLLGYCERMVHKVLARAAARQTETVPAGEVAV